MTSAPGAFPRRILKLGFPSLISPRAAAGQGQRRHNDGSRGSLPESDATRLITPVTIGGVPVDLTSNENATAAIMGHAVKGGSVPLGVLSANLDHVKHFGTGGLWGRTLESQQSMQWLTLLDGRPLVSQANKMTKQKWPRLAGSDLIESILERSEVDGLRVGFLGGTSETQHLVREKFATERPSLTVAGWWAPPREALEDSDSCRRLCAEMAEAQVDILVVCLGKPRQELWIAEYGGLTGAKVLLAFGAVVDFLAGRVRRAPALFKDFGMEWAWRLALEPRRLARRYLVDGPGAYASVRGNSSVGRPPAVALNGHRGYLDCATSALHPGRFAPADTHTDVAVLVVTYNNERDIGKLLHSLRQETTDQTIKVVIADNSASRETLDALTSEPDVVAFSTGGNRGYAGGLNQAIQHAGTADSYLILNPDLWLERGSIQALRDRMRASAAGIVVPKLLNGDGTTYQSLRREPSLLRSVGDALLGSRLTSRPGWLSEMDFNADSYVYPHPVEWATGAALLVSRGAAVSVGTWDERFFLYSEETDFFRRARLKGISIWYEPMAHMTHQGGASGASPELGALMAVNRIRYSRKHGGFIEAAAVHCIVAAAEVLRLGKPGRWLSLLTVTGLRRWDKLPKASNYGDVIERSVIPEGSIIIPAHNEAAVLGRTLRSLGPVLKSGKVEVIVACNGCSDATESIAGAVPGVRVITISKASKASALNAADRAATKWPRIYLDADIDTSPESLYQTLEELGRDDGPLAARPPFRYDIDGVAWPVRAYYRARGRIPSASSALWGAGIYGISESGHHKFGKFPPLMGDDLFVDGLFDSGEKKVLQCDPVLVRTPRSTGALVGTLKRVYRGNAEQRAGAGTTTPRTLRSLLISVRGPVSALDAVIYGTFALLGRVQRRGASESTWERDESSRCYPSPVAAVQAHDEAGGGVRT